RKKNWLPRSGVGARRSHAGAWERGSKLIGENSMIAAIRGDGSYNSLRTADSKILVSYRFDSRKDHTMNNIFSRRQWLGALAATAVTGLAVTCASPGQEAKPAADPFTYCLNTATIRGQGLSIVEEVDLVAKAGYQAIEPWINELERHVEKGGTLRELGRRIADAGLRVPSSIGFAEW